MIRSTQLALSLLLATALLSACAGAPAATPSPMPASPTVVPTKPPSPLPPTSTATAAATMTQAPTLTATLGPTATPTITATSVPTSAPTLPAAPGMQVEAIDPAQYAVRTTPPWVNIRAEASSNSAVLGQLDCGAEPVAVVAIASSATEKWYYMASGGWVRADVVAVFEESAEAEKAAQGAQCSASATPTPGSGTGSFAPTAQSIWEVPPSPDTPEGTCTSAPIAVPYGRIALTPDGDTLSIRDQSGSTYVLSRQGLNTFLYAGRSLLVAGQVTMTMTFTSETTWVMRTVTVLDEDPSCNHIHNYAANFLWYTR
jgi:hypothetical protein